RGPVGVVDGCRVDVVSVLQRHVAFEATGANAGLPALLRGGEPGAARTAVRAHVQLVTDTYDPDRRVRPQRPVRTRRRDLELGGGPADRPEFFSAPGSHRDRKSTRLNSSHQIISYAVFCLK